MSHSPARGRRALCLVFAVVTAPAIVVACSDDEVAGGDAGALPDASSGAEAAPVPDSAVTTPEGGGAEDAGCLVDASGPYLSDAVQVAGGLYHVCALRQTGSVVCWGSNQSGLLGVPPAAVARSDRPLTVAMPAAAKRIVRISSGNFHMCALDADRHVFCWGQNEDAQLGIGTIDDALHSVPTQVLESDGTTPHEAIALAASADTVCTITPAHEIACWGKDYHGLTGQVRDGGTFHLTRPERRAGEKLVGADPSLASGDRPSGHCAFDSLRAVCFGSNHVAQFEAPASDLPNQSNPDVATDLADAGATLPIRMIAKGYAHLCALDSTSRVYCRGGNSQGEIGPLATGHPTERWVNVPMDASVRVVSANNVNTYLGTTTGDVYAFGHDFYGQLGTGDVGGDASATPLRVVGVDGAGGLPPAGDVTGAGERACARLVSTCGVDGPGPVVCWGRWVDVDGGAIGRPRPVPAP